MEPCGSERDRMVPTLGRERWLKVQAEEECLRDRQRQATPHPCSWTFRRRDYMHRQLFGWPYTDILWYAHGDGLTMTMGEAVIKPEECLGRTPFNLGQPLRSRVYTSPDMTASNV